MTEDRWSTCIAGAIHKRMSVATACAGRRRSWASRRRRVFYAAPCIGLPVRDCDQPIGERLVRTAESRGWNPGMPESRIGSARRHASSAGPSVRVLVLQWPGAGPAPAAPVRPCATARESPGATGPAKSGGHGRPFRGDPGTPPLPGRECAQSDISGPSLRSLWSSFSSLSHRILQGSTSASSIGCSPFSLNRPAPDATIAEENRRQAVC